jgi:NCS1 family nucleobase:cation symporter-1
MLQGMTWWQAMITILLGNTIVLVPMVLNAHAGTKYGISFPVLCRASSRRSRANVPAMLGRCRLRLVWHSTWIGAMALNTLPPARRVERGVPGGIAIAFAVFWLLQVVIIAGGIERIKMLGSYAAPVLISGSVLLLAWGVRHGGGFAHILAESQRLQGKDVSNVSFWKLFPPALTANVGYWATLSLNIPDFTRYARSQRSQVMGQALGYRRR